MPIDVDSLRQRVRSREGMVVWLRILERRGSKETAELMGMSESEAERLYCKGLQRMYVVIFGDRPGVRAGTVPRATVKAAH